MDFTLCTAGICADGTLLTFKNSSSEARGEIKCPYDQPFLISTESLNIV